MKKLLTYFMAATFFTGAALALPKAFYVKRGETITKYNFGVAENLTFSNNGRTLSVVGYDEQINLDDIDYISFTAPLTSALTPAEQKQRLLQIGTKAYNSFNINDQADVLKMHYDFFVGDDNFKPAVDFYCPEEYVGVHGEFKEVLESVKGLFKGNSAAARIFRAKVINLYKIDDYNGIYTPDSKTETWVKTPCSDHLEIHFSGRGGASYVVSMTHSNDYTTWTTSDFNLRFPKVLTVTFSRNSNEIGKVTLNTTLNDRKSIDMTVEAVTNGYKVLNTLNVVDDAITDNVTITIRGMEFVTANSKVLGKNFVNYEEVYDAISAANGREDDYGNVIQEGDNSRLVAMFRRAQSECNLMGDLQVRGIIANASKVYNKLEEDADPYGTGEIDGAFYYAWGKVVSRSGGIIHFTETDKDVLGSQINTLNDNTDAGFYYDGNNRLQGYIGWDFTETPDEYVSEYREYEGYKTNGYAIINDLLYEVSREVHWTYDKNMGKDVLEVGPWQIHGYREDDKGNYLGSVALDVDEKDVIFPDMLVDHEYDMTPVLWFPDNTSFMFEDFFDEDSFSNLINDYNEIIDTYLSITGQE